MSYKYHTGQVVKVDNMFMGEIKDISLNGQKYYVLFGYNLSWINENRLKPIESDGTIKVGQRRNG